MSVSGSFPLALRMSTRVHAWLDVEETTLRSADAFCFLQLNYSSGHENCPSVSASAVCPNPKLHRAPFHVLLPTLSPRPSHFPATLATHIFLYPIWMYSSYLALTSPLITPRPPPRLHAISFITLYFWFSSDWVPSVSHSGFLSFYFFWWQSLISHPSALIPRSIPPGRSPSFSSPPSWW